MKLSDCKPGVRVRVYEGVKERFYGFIDRVGDAVVYVAKDNETFTKAYFPQQLRKIVPKKVPEVFVAMKYNGDCSTRAFCSPGSESEFFKNIGFEVWRMRGVEKL